MSDLVTSPAVVDFYNLMRDRISEQDIREFSPADPGYYDYVRVWSEIVSTGHVPNSWVWDLHEVISLTFGDLPGKVSDDPDRYRVYRLFLSSVEFHLWLTDGIGGSVLNYSAINLIDDSRDLNDPEILSLVGDVLRETATQLKLRSRVDMEIPFLHAAETIWAQRLGDYGRSEIAAKSLLFEENLARNSENFLNMGGDFLFRLTIHDQLDAKWVRAFNELRNPNKCPEMQSVINALAKERGLLGKLRRMIRNFRRQRFMKKMILWSKNVDQHKTKAE